ncbi:MAG: hypothetical protein M1828_003584 [Chrysothrix sp. TS-e1954]|nr:MAG: hypothetical protein M1828_003584 [Chrysothrix sp. TS-e1954]
MSTRKVHHTTLPYRERPAPHTHVKRSLLLPKHRDYTLRARSFNAKKTALRQLRKKAETRNEDEFSFGMLAGIRAKEAEGWGDGKGALKVRGVDGRRGEGGGELGQRVVEGLKRQDQGFLRVQLSRVRRERERLEQRLLVVERGPSNVEKGPEKVGEGEGQSLRVLGQDRTQKQGNEKKQASGGQGHGHTIFVEDSAAQRSFKPELFFETDGTGVRRAWNRPRLSSTSTSTAIPPPHQPTTVLPHQHPHNQQKHQAADRLKRHDSKKKQLHQEQQLKKLAGLRTRERELADAEREVAAQRDRMAGNVGGCNGRGVRFGVRERKR